MGDLIQTYKIINKIEEVDIDMGTGHNFMVGGGNPTRRHGHLIELEKWGSNSTRNKSLPNRSATTWNILPSEVLIAETVNVFKVRIDKYMSTPAFRRSIYTV